MTQYMTTKLINRRPPTLSLCLVQLRSRKLHSTLGGDVHREQRNPTPDTEPASLVREMASNMHVAQNEQQELVIRNRPAIRRLHFRKTKRELEREQRARLYRTIRAKPPSDRSVHTKIKWQRKYAQLRFLHERRIYSLDRPVRPQRQLQFENLP